MTTSEHLHEASAARPRGRLIVAAGLAIAALAAAAVAPGSASAAACAKADTTPGKASPGKLAGSTLCLINAERRRHELDPLRSDKRLASAAREHSSDMVRNQYFSHDTPEGTSFLKPIRQSGYLRSTRHWHVGQNLAWGFGKQSSAQRIVQAWMKSPPHRKAILTPRFRDAGIGVVRGVPVSSKKAPGATYTADFGVVR